MLNIQYSPFLVAYSDNPIPFQIEAGNEWRNPIMGASWGYWIDFTTNAVPAGTKIVITIYGIQLVVTMLPTGANISDNGLFVFENPSTTPINTWLTSVFLPTTAQNYHIKNTLSLQVVGNFLFINSPYDSFLSVSTDIPGATPALIGIGTPSMYPTNYNIKLDIFVTTNDGQPEKKVASLEGVPQKDEPWTAEFDLSGILSSFVDYELPSYNQTSITKTSKTCALVRVEFAEGYGSPVIYQHLNTGAWDMSFLVYKGGVPFHEFPHWRVEYPIEASNHWLTWKPMTLLASKKQQEYLYWLPIYSVLFPNPTIKAQLKGRVVYTDGTYVEPTFSPLITYDRYGVYIIPVGYQQLGIGSLDPSKEVERWSVWLFAPSMAPLSGSYVVSAIQEYILDKRCIRQETYFIFGNSLGGFDTLRCTTGLVSGIKISKDEYEPLTGWRYDFEQGQIIASSEVEENIKVNTGWVSLEYIKTLKDFLVSPSIYLIEDGRYLPVILLMGTVNLYSEGSGLYALEVSYKISNTSTDKFSMSNLQHV